MSRGSTRRSAPGREDPTVLVTGAGAPGASGVVRSLRATDERDVRIVGVDADPTAYGFALVDEAHAVPRGDDPGYVPRMAELVREADVDVVLPLTTAELQPLAERRDAIDATVMVSPADALAAANDKGDLYATLEAAGFASAPAFRRVDSEAGFRDALEALGHPAEPVCFKRPVASGMRGFRIVDEGTDRLSRLLTEKPDSTVTTADRVLPVLASGESFPELVVMEYLPGEEYSVDAVATDEAVRPVVPRTRSRTRAGITFQGTVEEDEELIEETAALCRHLGLEYNVNVQFRYDGEGTPKVIEINPRVSGTIVMCVGAGANLPYLGVKHALGEDVPPVDVAWGTRMVRYWQELFRDPAGRPFHVDPATPARQR